MEKAMVEKLCDVIAREAQCPQCRGELKEPKVLPCSHSICRKCLPRYPGPGVEPAVSPVALVCPACASEVSLTVEDVPCLPTNLAMESLLSAVRNFKAEYSSRLAEQQSSQPRFNEHPTVLSLPSRDCADGLVTTTDNRMAVVDRFGGIHLYSVNGSRDVLLDGVQKIKGVAFFQSGRFAILTSENFVHLYDSQGRLLEVDFDTLDVEEGGCSVIAGDKSGNIYVGYQADQAKRVHVFTPEGGRPVREIPCNGFKPKHLSITSAGELLVIDILYKPGGEVASTQIVVIDEHGRERYRIVKEGVHAQAAVGRNGFTLVSWLRVGEEEGTGKLTVEKYSGDMTRSTTLIHACELVTSTIPSYHLQEFATGELAFCTADRLYIFKKST